MYQAKIIKKAVDAGKLKITVEFSNGVKTYPETIQTSDKRDFERWIKERCAFFDNTETLDSDLKIGEVTIVEEIVTIVPKTDAQIEIIETTQNINYFEKLNRFVQLGLIQDTDKEYVELRSALRVKLGLKYIRKSV